MSQADTSLALRRRRLRYRASHRGTKEMDLMLGRFVEAKLDTLSEAEVTALEQVIALPDPDLEKMILGAPHDLPEPAADMLQRIRAFHGFTEGKEAE